MDKPLTLNDLNPEIKDLVTIGSSLVHECFQAIQSLETQVREDSSGSPVVEIQVIMKGDPHQAAKQFVTYQERWIEACPEIYRNVIVLIYNVERV